MENEGLVLLLEIIKNSESIQRMIEYGLEYYQISEYISFVLEQKYVIMKTDRLVITEKGLEQIKLLNSSNRKQWIRPLYEKRIKRLDKYDIYIPLK
ncbi:hypothetical protein [Clostridium intestinale]|uniref:hypothetical protein n=1 Tax=Clostridium intestinale TaxID=36845 RepID=UPI0028EB52F3|nr:hypothetical protein [Clostridium intestinale]